jgi:hypothetical protein
VDRVEVEEAGEVEESLDGAIVEGNSIVVTASGGCCRVVGAHVRWSPESLIDRSSLARCEVEESGDAANSYSEIMRHYYPPSESYFCNKLSVYGATDYFYCSIRLIYLRLHVFFCLFLYPTYTIVIDIAFSFLPFLIAHLHKCLFNILND